MRKNFSTIMLLVILTAGLILLVYPSAGDYYNSFHQTKAIVDYEGSLAALSDIDYSEILKKCEDYNRYFFETGGLAVLTDEQREAYESLLNLNGDGMMGYVEIPSIRVSLPIYHGTGDSVLKTAVGHLDWSSLPIGGAGTHSILSGHRGLASAKLFTNLDRLKPGDLFKLYILNETLTYQVDEIRVVTPEEAGQLNLIGNGDFCTLMTCTPYGINSHRLLVRGQRIYGKDGLRLTAEALQIEPMVIATVIAIPIFLIIMIIVMIKYR